MQKSCQTAYKKQIFDFLLVQKKYLNELNLFIYNQLFKKNMRNLR